MEIVALTALEPTKVKEQVKAHLERQGIGRWLFVFDSADDMQMWIKGTATTPPLRELLPKSNNGQVVFTSRN
jgi:hypothetical protein